MCRSLHYIVLSLVCNARPWNVCRSVKASASRAAADLLPARGVKMLVECSDLLPVDLCFVTVS
eukprot:COSAG05_NODE_5_length_47078_cov_547.868814_23_plen_63_part_00